MSDMIERVAKAMHMAVLPDDPWNPADSDCAAYYEAQYKCARAAIDVTTDEIVSRIEKLIEERRKVKRVSGNEYIASCAAFIRRFIDEALSQDTHSLPPTPEAAKPAGSTPPSSPAGTNSEAQP